MSAAPPPGRERAAERKACCAAAYAHPAARLLLGDSYHPGGLALTRRLLGLVGAGPGRLLVDVAAGTGASAALAACEHGAEVAAVDYSRESLAEARRRLVGAAERRQVLAVVADGERLPLRSGTADAVICECALCTFPDKPAGARELARVLRPGGRLGLSDVVADPSRLGEELRSLLAWVGCVAGALPLEGYGALLAEAGLEVVHVERHDHALAELVHRVRARVTAARMLAAVGGDQAEAAARGVDRVEQAVADGVLGYGVVVAAKPG